MCMHVNIHVYITIKIKDEKVIDLRVVRVVTGGTWEGERKRNNVNTLLKWKYKTSKKLNNQMSWGNWGSISKFFLWSYYYYNIKTR